MRNNTFLRSGSVPYEISIHTRTNDSQASRYFDAATITCQTMGATSGGEKNIFKQKMLIRGFFAKKNIF